MTPTTDANSAHPAEICAGAARFWVVDSDQFPVWLAPVDEADANEWIDRGEAAAKLPADAFKLTWAARHDRPERWYLFPAERA